MDVHALVYVEPKGDELGLAQLRYIDFLKLTHGFDISLILGAFDCNFNIKNLITVFVCDNTVCVHFLY